MDRTAAELLSPDRAAREGAALGQLGEVVFWKIAMKPGRPLAYGKIGGAHFFGLPGNPVSVMVTFYQFVREALLKLAGRDRFGHAVAGHRTIRLG